MRIYILGPSGSGKTYLAILLSEKLDSQYVSLDYLFFDHLEDKNRVEVSEKEWKKRLEAILKRKEWIIEGVNLIGQLFEKADLIVYLRPKFLSAVFNQWRRYFSDPKQRKEHGFINNLKLSRYLVRQYFQDPNIKKMDDPKYSRVKKMDLLVKKFPAKTVILKNQEEINNFNRSFFV